jgi:hypothetical protein
VRHLKIVQQRITKLTSSVNQNAPAKSVMQKSQSDFIPDENFEEAGGPARDEGNPQHHHEAKAEVAGFEYSTENTSNKNYLGNAAKVFP